MSLAVRGHNDNLVDTLIHAGFEEEGDFIDDYGLGMLMGDRLGPTSLLAGDAWVNDPFEPAEFGSVTKDDRPEFVAIYRAIRAQDAFPERLHDGSPRRLPWLHHVAGELVGIDDDRAESFERFRNGGFPRRDSACETDKNHGGGA